MTQNMLQRSKLWLLVAIIVTCAIGGGSNRIDAALLLPVRMVAAICTGLLLLAPGAGHARPVRTLAILLAGWGLLMGLQLLPVPPALWQSLPGRAGYADAAAIVGQAQPWRPWSLTPDLTLNSLVALIPIAGTLLGLSMLEQGQREWLVAFLITLALTSILLASAQIAGGPGSVFYTYTKTYQGYAVGLLANRNHQAVWLAATLPLLAAWLRAPAASENRANLRLLVVGAMVVLTFPAILLTGSRTGMALSVVGLAGFVLLVPVRGRMRRVFPTRTALVAAVAGVGVLLMALFLLFGRALVIDRLLQGDYAGELRLINTPTTIALIWEYFPFGAGFGGFDPIFRGAETERMLRSTYFNHAHNDLLEVLLAGGIASAILLGAFAVWFTRATLACWRATESASKQDIVNGRAAGIGITILLLGSLTDYPLRTPFLGTIFILLCGLVAYGSAAARNLRYKAGSNQVAF